MSARAAVVSSVRASCSHDSRRPSAAAPRAGRSDAAVQPSLLRQTSLRLAAGLAAACVALQPVATAPPAALAAEALSPPAAAPAQEFEFGGKMLFDPMAYTGRWYEVASLKKGFAGEGQQDCHCTQGIYVPKEDPKDRIRLQVNTFCVHGGPSGRLSGIQGSVSCANPVVLELLPEFLSEMDRMEGVVAKCALRFDSLPFIPPEPYVVLRTDYTTYALVRGAKDRSFVQVYSRTPNPGPAFIQQQKATLAALGYPANEIIDTPQDCADMSPAAMMAAMDRGMAGAQLMPASTPAPRAMRGYDLGPTTGLGLTLGSSGGALPDVDGGAPRPVKGITFDSLRNPFETLRNVFSLFSN